MMFQYAYIFATRRLITFNISTYEIYKLKYSLSLKVFNVKTITRLQRYRQDQKWELYKFCSMECFLQLDIIHQIVYNNNMANFCPYYQLINIWDRIR